MVAIAAIAGGTWELAASLGLAMLGLQFSIGAVNDLVDQAHDARTKPSKPIPAGLVSRRSAWIVAIVGGAVGIAISAVHGPAILALALAMYACGLAYDLFLKPTPFASLAYAIAFPLLPVYAWLAGSGDLPPRLELLLPVAALAGPTIQLANGLVDVEDDTRTGLRGPVVRLGRHRALVALAVLEVLVHGLAWASLLARAAPPTAILVVAGASGLAIMGVILSAGELPQRRERGWQAQALAIVLLGGGWLLAASG